MTSELTALLLLHEASQARRRLPERQRFADVPMKAGGRQLLPQGCRRINRHDDGTVCDGWSGGGGDSNALGQR